jgi:hypothetical protein
MLLDFLISLALAADAPAPNSPDIVLALGEGSPDRRAVKSRTLNDTDFDFIPPTNAAAWKSRSADLRLQVQIACGLYPYPAKTPLNATIRSGAIRDGYRVDKVVFESMCQLTKPLVYGLPFFARTAIGQTDVFFRLQTLRSRQRSRAEQKKHLKALVLPCKPVAHNWLVWDALFFTMTWWDMLTMAPLLIVEATPTPTHNCVCTVR